jgi:hypothetical protein
MILWLAAFSGSASNSVCSDMNPTSMFHFFKGRSNNVTGLIGQIL